MSKKHEDVAKAPNRKSSGSGILIGILLVIAVVVVISMSSTPEVDYETYNGFNFVQLGDFWQTQIEFDGELYDVPFYNHPLDVEPILYDDRITQFMLDRPHQLFFIAVAPDAGSVPVLGGVNIARITGQIFKLPTRSALYLEDEQMDAYNESEYTRLNCKFASALQPVIWIQTNASISGAYFSDINPNCIIVSGTDNDEVLRIADIFAYKILGIIPADE